MSSLLRRIARDAHYVSRTAGDLDATQRGPEVLARRLARREATRSLFTFLRRGGVR